MYKRLYTLHKILTNIFPVQNYYYYYCNNKNNFPFFSMQSILDQISVQYNIHKVNKNNYLQIYCICIGMHYIVSIKKKKKHLTN